jgi:hypothetical protein
VIANPPVLAGAVQVSATFAAPAVSVPRVGAPGKAAGVTAADAAELVLVPTELVAVILNTYAVPLVKPVTVSEVALDASVLDQFVQVEPELLE